MSDPSTPTSGFPVHVINLDRSPDRLAQFRSRNAHLRNIVRFAAVDGRTLDREKLVQDGVITPDCMYTDGALGVALSHIALWRKAADERRAITIAEDDAIFSHMFESQAQRVLTLLPPDWDIIFWGWNFDADIQILMLPGISDANMLCDQDRLRDNIDQFQSLAFSPFPVKMLHLWGLMCCTVSPKGARSLLNACLPLSDILIEFPGIVEPFKAWALDAAMNGIFPSLKSFVCIPPLVVSENRHETSTVRDNHSQ